MAQIIKLKRSSVSGNVPTTGQMDTGELALNTADGKLFLRDNSLVRPIVTVGNEVTGSITITGDLKVGNYLVGANQYAFKFAGAGDYGLYFNGSTSTYDFNDSNGDEVFSIDVGNGNTDINGYIAADSVFMSITNTNATAGTYGIGSQLIHDLEDGQSLTKGDIYYWRSTSAWDGADASAEATAKGLLTVCNTIDGSAMVSKGMVTINTSLSGMSNGDVLYLSTTTGKVTNTAPSSTGEIVRIVGYVISTTKNLMYFDPSKDWIEIA
jgi:hypothetical protein